MTPAVTQNLNSKLGPAPRRRGTDEIGVSWKATAIQTSAPPVRIFGAGGRYQGGYRVNV